MVTPPIVPIIGEEDAPAGAVRHGCDLIPGIIKREGTGITGDLGHLIPGIGVGDLRAIQIRDALDKAESQEETAGIIRELYRKQIAAKGIEQVEILSPFRSEGEA